MTLIIFLFAGTLWATHKNEVSSMNEKRVGKRTIALSHPPSVISYANIGGKQEAEGPLSSYFDELSDDSFFGEKTWEKAESTMQKKVVQRALDQAKLKPGDLDYICAGDLLNQCIGSSFGLRDFGIPFYGLYGACSTMGESLSLAAMLIDGGYASRAAAVTSSHFCTAERQYRMPVPYGSQRTPTAQWTATAAGCTILAEKGQGPYVTHVICGRIVDKGITDSNNMGAAMAPAAYDTLSAFFRDTQTGPKDYDLILTGDWKDGDGEGIAICLHLLYGPYPVAVQGYDRHPASDILVKICDFGKSRGLTGPGGTDEDHVLLRMGLGKMVYGDSRYDPVGKLQGNIGGIVVEVIRDLIPEGSLDIVFLQEGVNGFLRFPRSSCQIGLKLFLKSQR